MRGIIMLIFVRRPVYWEAGGAPAHPQGELQGEAGDGGHHEAGLYAQDHPLPHRGGEEQATNTGQLEL